MNKIRTTTSNCLNGLVAPVAAGIIIFLVMSVLHEAFALTSEEIRRLGIEARSTGKPFDQYVREIFYANNITPASQKQAFVRLDNISNELLQRCHGIVQHGGLFGKIEQRISDLLCAATGAFVIELCQAFPNGQLLACSNPKFKQDMDKEGLVVDRDSDRIAYRLLLDNPFTNNTSSRPINPTQ